VTDGISAVAWSTSPCIAPPKENVGVSLVQVTFPSDQKEILLNLMTSDFHLLSFFAGQLGDALHVTGGAASRRCCGRKLRRSIAIHYRVHEILISEGQRPDDVAAEN
jgi:hypothetical protein